MSTNPFRTIRKSELPEGCEITRVDRPRVGQYNYTVTSRHREGWGSAEYPEQAIRLAWQTFYFPREEAK